jgi:hypothetical protein
MRALSTQRSSLLPGIPLQITIIPTEYEQSVNYRRLFAELAVSFLSGKRAPGLAGQAKRVKI